MYIHICFVYDVVCIRLETEVDGSLSQPLSTLVFGTGSLTESEARHSDRLISIPFKARIIDIGTRGVNSVPLANANTAPTELSFQPLFIYSGDTVFPCGLSQPQIYDLLALAPAALAAITEVSRHAHLCWYL